MSATVLKWFKSTYSSGSGDDCVEVALSWRKSSYGSGGSGDCVEVAARPGVVHVRDSKERCGPQLAVSPHTWAGFLTYATGR